MENRQYNPYIEGPFPVTHAEMDRARAGVDQFERLLLKSRGSTRDYLLFSDSGEAIQAVLLGIRPAITIDGEGSFSEAAANKVAEFIHNSNLTEDFNVFFGENFPFFMNVPALSKIISDNPDIFKDDMETELVNLNKEIYIDPRIPNHLRTFLKPRDIKFGLILGFPTEAIEYFTQERTRIEEQSDLRRRRAVGVPGFVYAVGSADQQNTPFTRRVSYVFEASGMNRLVDFHMNVSAPRFFKI